MGATMGGGGAPPWGLWGSTALIAPDEPRCRLGPTKRKRHRERVCELRKWTSSLRSLFSFNAAPSLYCRTWTEFAICIDGGPHRRCPYVRPSHAVSRVSSRAWCTFGPGANAT